VNEERQIVTPSSVPDWPRGVRLRYDEAREKWVIVSPEKVSVPNETAVEILKLVDGEHTATGIAEILATQYEASKDLILRDVVTVLQTLSDKGIIAC